MIGCNPIEGGLCQLFKDFFPDAAAPTDPTREISFSKTSEMMKMILMTDRINTFVIKRTHLVGASSPRTMNSYLCRDERG